MAEVFLDASYAIALASPHDQHHQRAVALARRVEQESLRLVTTQAVVLEIGNALSRRQYRAQASVLLASLRRDPAVEIVPLTEAIFDRGVDLFRRRADKQWGLTDCLSFVVMEERGVTEALTADGHFEQAGFRALLLAEP
jgi:predicted nucleic acid-binding protein